MGRRIPGVQISLHAFIVSIFVLYIVVKCSLILPKRVGPAQPSQFFYITVFEYRPSYSLGMIFHFTCPIQAAKQDLL